MGKMTDKYTAKKKDWQTPHGVTNNVSVSIRRADTQKLGSKAPNEAVHARCSDGPPQLYCTSGHCIFSLALVCLKSQTLIVLCVPIGTTSDSPSELNGSTLMGWIGQCIHGCLSFLMPNRSWWVWCNHSSRLRAANPVSIGFFLAAQRVHTRLRPSKSGR